MHRDVRLAQVLVRQSAPVDRQAASESSEPEAGSNEGVQCVLEDRCGGVTGPERRRQLDVDVAVFSDQYGSHRFVRYVDGVPVAGIQVMSRKQGSGFVTKAYTLPGYRRQGYAADLCRYAEKMLGSLTYSDDVSLSGRAFVQHQVGE